MEISLPAATAIPALEVPTLPPKPQQAEETGREVHLKVNGKDHRLEVEDHWTLAEVLRDHLGFTGTRVGCDRGECGACTVLLDGKSLYSCSYLAVWAEGKEISTVEGLAEGDQLDPLQEAFIRHGAAQCGFCTSGMLMTCKALLAENPNPTREEIGRYLNGNICRCGAYLGILAAIQETAAQGQKR